MNQLDAHGRPVPYPPAVKHSHKEGDKVVVLRDDKWYEATKLPKALWPRGLRVHRPGGTLKTTPPPAPLRSCGACGAQMQVRGAEPGAQFTCTECGAVNEI